MSNEMPEELYASTELDCSDLVLAHRQHEDGDAHYIRADKYAELRRQNAALKEFANKVLNMAAEGDGIYDDEVQALAEKLSLLVKKTATQEDLDSDEMLQMRYDLEVGGTFLDYAPWMLTDTAAMPAPSRAEVAREFAKAVFEHADIVGYFGPLCMKEVLKEWENETR